MRDATFSWNGSYTSNYYFNPRIPCGMRQNSPLSPSPPDLFQSTHPMRDATGALTTSLNGLCRFQSTHPMRDATIIRTSIHAITNNFNPRIPCGMRPQGIQGLQGLQGISIHASHAGCDQLNACCPAPVKIPFQSTHPMRDAT